MLQQRYRLEAHYEKEAQDRNLTGCAAKPPYPTPLPPSMMSVWPVTQSAVQMR